MTARRPTWIRLLAKLVTASQVGTVVAVTMGEIHWAWALAPLPAGFALAIMGGFAIGFLKLGRP